MTTAPHTTFITRSVLGVNLALNSDMTVEIVRNQITEAEAKPPTKKRSVPSGRVALKAPSIMLPSMRACGLNQVTNACRSYDFDYGDVYVLSALEGFLL